VSSPEHDYIHDGFIARTHGEELPAKGTTCRITESYQDVSNQVLSALKDTMSFTERTKAIERKIKEIVAAEETKNKEIRAEVSEMFIGKTYVLFRYRMIKDVRLVYVPPRSIGEFGGEEDNWIWPRHTGDFSFMRAYVGPDGRSADYSTANVPYQPKKFLKVNPEGVNENDFVFILGYPGRTFRHQTSHFLEYQQRIQLPFIADWFGWQIDEMTKMGKADHSVDIKLSARIKGLANVMKNYRGKLKGLARLPLVETKRNEEGQLQKFIEKDKQRNAVYGNVLNQIGSVYSEMMKEGKRSLILGQIYGSSTLLNMGRTVLKFAEETRKPDLERETEFMDRNLPRLKQSIPLRYNSYHQPADKLFLKHILLDAAQLPAEQKIQTVEKIIAGKDLAGALDEFVENMHARSKLADLNTALHLLDQTPDEIKTVQDPFIEFARELEKELKKDRDDNQRRQGALNKLYGQLQEVKKMWLSKSFIPDANSTLRLTYGHIKGYTPADGTYYSPITTLTGMMEKYTGEEPWDLPEKVRTLYRQGDFGKFRNKSLNNLPVAILYDMDTTGGNSGSPVLDANGNLVGVNFDRTFEATINDYAWSESYSRSIAVDIRFVLWYLQKVAGADFLLNEMGIKG
jgi:hypothetical protein